MPRIITICFALFCCVHLAAQTGYIPAQSPVTLVYKIADAEAEKLYRGRQKSLNEKMLRHCVDSLRGIAQALPDGYPDGHYLLVNAQGNHLHFRLASIVPFEHRLLNNQRDMALVVFNRKTGQTVANARVKVGNKRLRFDEKTQSYRRTKTDKQGVLSIEADGMTAYFTITRQYNLNGWKRTKGALWNAPVVKYVSRPVIFVTNIPMDTYRSIRRGYPTGSIYGIRYGWMNRLGNMFHPPKNNNNGFMVFGKPKYRPDDTIRFKAYVANKKGKPVKDSLDVYLWVDKERKIGTIAPYRPGFYTMEFVPKADYGMKLDRRYNLYIGKDKKRQDGYFYYEDYELKSVEYHIRADKEEYFSHEEVTFYAKATDENNMPVMDARVELTLLTESIRDFCGDRVRVPDVLWKTELMLDPLGETKIVVPDSVWHNASIDVKMIANFSNSDNRTGYKDLRFLRKNTAERIIAAQRADSLYIRYESRDKPVNGMQARIRRGWIGDTLVTLPACIRIHPLVDNYKIVAAHASDENCIRKEPAAASFFPSEDNSGVACSMNRVRDSIFIMVDNPLGLPLIYTVYRGNKERQRGTGRLSTYKAKTSKKDYFLSVQYIWGGKEYRLEYRSGYDATQLQLNTSLPAVVFPGQTVKVHIVATDANGNPVPNVDLTAYGFTAKFGEQPMPALPSYQKPPSSRKSYNSFTSREQPEISRQKDLDVTKWQQPLKLDSTELYRFAYPEKEIYRYSFPAADGRTYIAPYLVHNGKLLPIQILYIDDRPVYFGRTTTYSSYVFPVTEGIHTIRLRTTNFEVKARIVAQRGYKTIVSIDPYQWNRKIMESDGYHSWGTIDKKKSEYSPRELNLMRNYLMRIGYQPTDKFAWLQHGNTYELLTPEKPRSGSGRRTFISGPIGGRTPVILGEETKSIYAFERGGYQWYEYEPLSLRTRTESFNYFSDYNTPSLDWNKLPYTKHYVDSVSNKWNINRMRQTIQYANLAKYDKTGQLQVETTWSDSLKNEGWCWILYDHARDESQFYPLSGRKFVALNDGIYSLFLLMADKTFYVCDSISLETDATTMLRLPVEKMRRSTCPIDSCRREPPSLLRDINLFGGMDVNVPPSPPKPRPVETPVRYNAEYVTGIDVCGTVTDNDGGIPGVSVTVKGTTICVATDVNGNYCIRVPQGYRTLEYSFIGYETEERTPLQDGNVDVILQEAAYELEEVVVVGYGYGKANESVRRREVRSSPGNLYSMSQVSGRRPGSISGGPREDLISNKRSYYHMSGGETASMDAREMMQQLLEDEIYQTGLASAKGLRTNFSDEAFWQPSLATDRSGVASFTATFPDDVTRWNLRFVGMLPGKASAAAQTQMRSFKPLMGQLSVPRFMVEGDTANVIGKVTNYGQDTVRLTTEFAIDGVAKANKTAKVRHSLIDTLTVAAPDFYGLTLLPSYGLDSIAVRYQLTRDDGYQDGEERHIPIVRRGTTESIGQFHTLDTDTTLTLSLDGYSGAPVALSLESSSLDIMLKETRRLRDYQHLCNEQTASRLKALLLERKAYQLHGKEYPYDRNIRSLVERLIKGRNDYGLWGWFGGNDAQETWISTHVVEALLQARDDGFKVNMDFENVTNRLILNFDVAHDIDRLRLLGLLVRINPETNYRAMFDKIDMQRRDDTDMQRRGAPRFYYADSLRWMELALHFSEKVDMEKVLQRKHVDRLGNIHWTESDDAHWRYNDVAVTLAAYRLLRSCGEHDRTLLKIRNYLLTQRSHIGWRNTYETADILTTVMPDILASGDSIGKPRVRISDRDAARHVSTIDTFPKQITLHGNEPLVIEKKGAFPVYVTAWQEIFVREPEPVNEGFRVETRFVVETGRAPSDSVSVSVFETGRAQSLQLVAGKAATLEVSVSSDVASEYVVIEIPIPAGCSYQSKPQSYYWRSGETHREYFRDRVCIYLRRMSEGSHTFRVELMPRYTGIYHVNPAKAERMYMPLYYGRTEVKEVGIR